MKTPVLLVFAGPNGSGKSTITSQYPIFGEYVNADAIQAHLKCSSLEAAQVAEQTREKLLEMCVDFTFETVLSTMRNYKLIERAKVLGYTVVCVFVLTCNPQINISRVKSRKKMGGHDVPPEKVESRYARSLALFPRLFDVCDECYVFDNSLDRFEGEPHMIVKYQYGKMDLYPNSIWSVEMIQALCRGVYEYKDYLEP